MSKFKHLFLLPTFVIGLATVISSCDSSPNESTAESLDFSAYGYDVETLQANATGIANMPAALEPGDVMDYSFANVNNGAPITVDGSRQLLFATFDDGDLSVTTPHLYSNGLVSMSSQYETVDGDDFERKTDELLASGAGSSSGTFSSFMDASDTSAATAITSFTTERLQGIADSLRSIGYIVDDTPISALPLGTPLYLSVESIDGEETNVEVVYALGMLFQTTTNISHTVTSTNQEILDSGIIRGQATITLSYSDICVVDVENADLLEMEPLYSSPARVSMFSFPIINTNIPFTLTLNSDLN